MDHKLVALAITWAVLLGGFLIYAAYPTLTGTDVTLKLRPVDPQDLLKGDYVMLSYDLSQLDLTSDYQYGDTVYVALRQEGDAWVANGVSHEKPSSGVFIKGSVSEGWRSNVVYGIEQYYIPEASGRDIRLDGSYSAKVAIDGNGNARVVAVLHDGKEVDFVYQPPYQRYD